MDGSRFDAWTRRRFGVLAGGAIAALVAGAAPVAEAKKKKRKRCKKLGASCKVGGRKCCKKLVCDETEESPTPFHCCRPDGDPCTKHEQCCNGCNQIEGLCEAA